MVCPYAYLQYRPNSGKHALSHRADHTALTPSCNMIGERDPVDQEMSTRVDDDRVEID